MTRIFSASAKLLGKSLGLAALLSLGASNIWAQSGAIYNNTTTNQSFVFDVRPRTVAATNGFTNGVVTEFGEQVFLSGNARRITDFTVGISLATNSSASTIRNETASLTIYRDNPGGTPTFLSSTPFVPLTLGAQEVTFNALSIDLGTANTLTYTVTFAGVDTGETAGLLVFGAPTVGTSLDDMFIRFNGNFYTLGAISTPGGPVPANFYARIIAVPEPSTWALLAMVAVAGLSFRQMRRKTA